MADTRDYMVRAMAAGRELRAFAVTSRDLVETARQAHGTTPVVTAALGRTLSGALMMSSMLKDPDGLITVQFKGDGPIGGITATADAHGNVKGYPVQPLVALPSRPDHHLDVGRAVGKGTLTVIRDIDRDHTYNGQIAIHSGEIADDLTYYFAESEQIPSSVGLGVKVEKDCTVGAAGGFIIQLMPQASEETIARLEDNLRTCRYVTDILDEGRTPEELLQEVLKGFSLEITETLPVRFHCSCSRDRVARALKLIGRKELQELIDEKKPQELRCHFCGKRYTFSTAELEDLRDELDAERKAREEGAKAADAREAGSPAGPAGEEVPSK